jgi:hypothetical protein
MLRTILLILLFTLIAINLSCQTANTINTNSNANAIIVNQSSLPPGFSTSPIQPSGNTTPGIPDPKTINANNSPKGTPTPGIPDPSKLGKNLPKGATPTPGIPDPNTLKTQKTPPFGNPNEVNVNSNIQPRQVRRKP